MANATAYAKELVNDLLVAPEASWLETCRTHDWVCSVCGDFPADLRNAPAYEHGLCPRCTDTLPE